MSVGQLYEQYRTERGFNWYAKDPEWRRLCRECYPVEIVSAYHRGEFTEEFWALRKERMRAFRKEMDKRMGAQSLSEIISVFRKKVT